MHKVASATSIKLMGVPVTDNDPLGALNNHSTSPGSMQKSATASELLQNKRPSLQENILGSPFSNSSLEMSRSSTMPLSGENEEDQTGQNKGYFSMASIKNMTKTGTSRLASLKKNSYLSSGNWMSPNSKESLNKGISSLRSAYSSATSTISKRVEEFRETPSKMQGASSNPNLFNQAKDEDTLSTNSDNRRPSEFGDQPDSWSNFTGQIWDQLWSYGQYNPAVQSHLNQAQNQKLFLDLFEELYEKMPTGVPAKVAMTLEMTSCSQCKNCNSILYDEEIIAGWTAEDSNLNTRCPFCCKLMVPHLTVQIIDQRSEKDTKSSVQVPYLSPLVLRKELESILEREGDACLSDAECVNDHPIIYWNLIWFFERIGVSSHLPGMCLKKVSPETNKDCEIDNWSQADHRNIQIKILWDNKIFYPESGTPLYQKSEECAEKVRMICEGVQTKDLLNPIKNLLEHRQENSHLSIYREMMFVTLKSFGQENIDLTAFDREYRRAFEKLQHEAESQSLLRPCDRPPNNATAICRKFFRELKI